MPNGSFNIEYELRDLARSYTRRNGITLDRFYSTIIANTIKHVIKKDINFKDYENQLILDIEIIKINDIKTEKEIMENFENINKKINYIKKEKLDSDNDIKKINNIRTKKEELENLKNINEILNEKIRG